MQLREVREKQSKLVADARSKLEEIKDDTTAERAAEINREHDTIMAEYDRLEERAKRLEVLVQREAQMNAADPRRPQGGDVVDHGEQRGAGGGQADVEAARRSAFVAFLRGGTSNLSSEQRSLLVRAPEQRDGGPVPQGVGAGATGGYLVPQGFMAELIIALKAWGPMLDPGIVRDMTTAKGNSIPWPTMDDTSNTGALISENTQVALAEVQFGTKTIEAYKYTSGVVLVSSELLGDSALDVEQIVRDAMAERVGRIVNTHLTTGDGNSKPNGIVTAAGTLAAAAAAAITFDDMIDLFHAVDPAYRNDPSCRWQFNDATLKLLRTLKDGQGRYIWQPANVATAQPQTILDKPYSVNQAMAAVGASAKSVIFGAHSRYLVRRVNEFAVRRLVERYADFDQTGFIGFSRFDGELLDNAAVKALAHPAQ